MENLGHKKNTCEEKNIFLPKMTSENAFKKCGFTYKSQILKFKIQQKVFNKKDAFKCSKFSLNLRLITFRVFKMQKTCNFLKESNNFRFFAIYSLKKCFLVNIKKIENI
jgi:hypothetical protein